MYIKFIFIVMSWNCFWEPDLSVLFFGYTDRKLYINLSFGHFKVYSSQDFIIVTDIMKENCCLNRSLIMYIVLLRSKSIILIEIALKDAGISMKQENEEAN